MPSFVRLAARKLHVLLSVENVHVPPERRLAIG
jgi:hypothetical protein